MRVTLLVVLIVAMIAAGSNRAHGHDRRDMYLRKVQEAYALKPLVGIERERGAKFELGRALFFDPIISGNREIACATCHFPRAASADGLPIAVGVGARGTGPARLEAHGGFAQRRNALAFWGLGEAQVTRLFWDGRVQTLEGGKYFTPIGDFSVTQVGSLLGAAALLPVIEADEMTGFEGDQSPSWVAVAHRAQPNDLAVEGESKDPNRAWAIHQTIIRRVLGDGEAQRTAWQDEYRRLYSAAYRGRSPEAAMYQDLASAIGEFISTAFALKPAPWDRYLAGDDNAISSKAKDGALVFFGKGKCAVCHSGTLFSDFEFHALAIPQIGRGLEAGGIDPGRGGVTRNPDDRYKFRTPILRNVALTAPYGHSGYFSRLEDVIAHHSNPIPALYRAQQNEPASAGRQARLVAYLAPELRDLEPLSAVETAEVVAFLNSLTSADLSELSRLVPDRVPSGLDHVVSDIRKQEVDRNTPHSATAVGAQY